MQGKSSNHPSFEHLNEAVKVWALERRIIQNSTMQAQLGKLLEERQETLQAETREELVDGFGDMLVCVLNAAAIADVDPVQALDAAYNQIKDRKGTLGSDGIFYKQE